MFLLMDNVLYFICLELQIHCLYVTTALMFWIWSDFYPFIWYAVSCSIMFADRFFFCVDFLKEIFFLLKKFHNFDGHCKDNFCRQRHSIVLNLLFIFLYAYLNVHTKTVNISTINNYDLKWESVWHVESSGFLLTCFQGRAQRHPDTLRHYKILMIISR